MIIAETRDDAMGRILGTDVSVYQKEIDFDRMAETGVTFCISKASQGLRAAKNFDRNYAESKRVGLTRGGYHLIELDEDIDSQVFLYLTIVRFEPGDLPPVLDVETKKIDEVGPEKAHEGILHWLTEVEKLTGATPILYISPRGVRHLEGHTAGLERFFLWVVDHEDPEPGLTQEPVMPVDEEGEPIWDTWTMWQWTSDADGAYYGVGSDDLDLDYFNGCVHDLEAFVAENEAANPWSIDVEAAQAYNDGRDYNDAQIANIISWTSGNFWYERDVIYKIAAWQYLQGDLAVDGKVGPATYQALVDDGMPDAS